MRCGDLVDRLRGIYTIPVEDGGGLLSGKDTHTSVFEVPPIHGEAADEIVRLRSREADAHASHRADLEDLLSCVDDIECGCLDPPEDHNPPGDPEDYQAHSYYCWRYLYGHISKLIARLPVVP